MVRKYALHWRLILLFALLTLPRSAIAFSRDQEGLFVDTTVIMEAGFIEVGRGNFFLNCSRVSSSMVGLSLKHTLSWARNFSLGIQGGLAHSVGGSGLMDSYVVPARTTVFDLTATLYTSVPLGSNRVFLEPLVGMSAIKIRTNMTHGDVVPWAHQLFWGPLVGMYLRVLPLEYFSWRVGGGYIAPRYRDVFYKMDGTRGKTVRMEAYRRGMFALLGLDYQVNAWLGLRADMDYKFLAVSGYDNGHIGHESWQSPYILQARITWSLDFTY